MLSLQSFISGMELLKKCFIGWQFDTKDEMQVKVWYAAFKNLTDEQYKSLIKDYYVHNQQPPKSVRDLTNVLVDKIYLTAKIPPEKGLGIVRDIISECGGWEYGGKTEIYKKLQNYPVSLMETVKEFEDSLKSMPANDPYVSERFRKAYAVRLRASAIREVDKRLGLSINDNNPTLGSAATQSKLLGGALPYEE